MPEVVAAREKLEPLVLEKDERPKLEGLDDAYADLNALVGLNELPKPPRAVAGGVIAVELFSEPLVEIVGLLLNEPALANGARPMGAVRL